MERNKRNQTINELKQSGFSVVSGYRNLYVNKNGKVFNLNTGRYLKPTQRNYIITDGKYLNAAKLILMVFSNEPYRDGQIIHIDGNKSNLSVKNLKYARIHDTNTIEKVNKADLLKAIRCYFSVEKSFSVDDHLRKTMYLHAILDKRLFLIDNAKAQYIEVFKTYIGTNILNRSNIAQTAKQHGLSYRDCNIIVNQFQNQLVSEILSDLQNGVLSIQDFKPKPKTKTEAIKELNTDLVKRGKKPLPLREKSDKQKVSDYLKNLNNH